MRRILNLLLAPFALLVLFAPAEATWSIVAVDTRTGEVAVASATCLVDFDLRAGVPLVLVGQGAAAAQSALDDGAVNRRLILQAMREGKSSREIFDFVRENGTRTQTRQYGIVSMVGDPFTFTGNQAGLAATGVRGEVGSIKYAVQGNVLVGDEVVFAARTAFVRTDGDLAQRLMAAMEAARKLGGDGRCSCSQAQPTSCGVPPRDGFEKSAHVGFVIVARIGDEDGTCTGGLGCANGPYYLSENVIGGPGDPDPVFTLQDQVDSWRAGLVGRPDGVLSYVKQEVPSLPADGRSSTRMRVQLVDIEGTPLREGGATLKVQPAPGSGRWLATPGPVVDHGDGSYSFPVTAGTGLGTQEFEIMADDGAGQVTLYPYPALRLEAPSALRLAWGPVRRGGDSIDVSLEKPEAAGSPYVLRLRLAPGRGLTVGSGRLDGSGRAELNLPWPQGEDRSGWEWSLWTLEPRLDVVRSRFPLR